MGRRDEPELTHRVLASGRSADILDVGNGRVVRRRRNGPIAGSEVRAMSVARAHGFPAPEVVRVEGTDMEMERVAGRSMLDELGARPWRARSIGRRLGELHLLLRRVPPPDDLPGDEPREALVHNDLHPGNVIVSPNGPVVIDWEGASTGPADRDVAVVWLLSSIADVDGLAWYLRPFVGVVRRRMLAGLLATTGVPRPETVDAVCASRLSDPNMRDHERERIRRFRERHGLARSDAGPTGPIAPEPPPTE